MNVVLKNKALRMNVVLIKLGVLSAFSHLILEYSTGWAQVDYGWIDKILLFLYINVYGNYSLSIVFYLNVAQYSQY